MQKLGTWDFLSERVLYGGKQFFGQGENLLQSFSISSIAKLHQSIPIGIVFCPLCKIFAEDMLMYHL